MTDVNLEAVTARFIDMAQQIVGDKLATFGSTDVPAVVSTRDALRMSKYPYILVDMANISDNAYRKYEHYNESEDLETWSDYNVLMTYSVFSSDSATHSAKQIAFELKSALSRRDIITQYNAGGLGALIRIDPVNVNYSNRDNEVREVAALNILYTVLSVETNEEYKMNQIISDVDEKYLDKDPIIHEFTIDVDISET